jgi:hypothetical protein
LKVKVVEMCALHFVLDGKPKSQKAREVIYLSTGYEAREPYFLSVSLGARELVSLGRRMSKSQ